MSPLWPPGPGPSRSRIHHGIGQTFGTGTKEAAAAVRRLVRREPSN